MIESIILLIVAGSISAADTGNRFRSQSGIITTLLIYGIGYVVCAWFQNFRPRLLPPIGLFLGHAIFKLPLTITLFELLPGLVGGFYGFTMIGFILVPIILFSFSGVMAYPNFILTIGYTLICLIVDGVFTSLLSWESRTQLIGYRWGVITGMFFIYYTIVLHRMIMIRNNQRGIMFPSLRINIKTPIGLTLHWYLDWGTVSGIVCPLCR